VFGIVRGNGPKEGAVGKKDSDMVNCTNERTERKIGMGNRNGKRLEAYWDAASQLRTP